jgi:hypothetical protein
MPFVSESQRRKWKAMVAEGTISQEKFDEWTAATGDNQLPERVEKPEDSNQNRPSLFRKRRKPRLFNNPLRNKVKR